MKKIILIKSLIATFAIGLFAVDTSGSFLSNDKDKSILLKPVSNLNNEEVFLLFLGLKPQVQQQQGTV